MKLIRFYFLSIWKLYALVQANADVVWKQEKLFYWSNNCDSNVNNFDDGSEMSNMNECACTCNERRGCTHFSWSIDYNWCKHKYGPVDQSKVFYRPNRVCGIMNDIVIINDFNWKPDELGNYIWGNECSFLYYNSLTEMKTRDVYECIEACEATYLCSHFSYSMTYKSCLLQYGRTTTKDASFKPKSLCGIMDRQNLPEIIWENHAKAGVILAKRCDFDSVELPYNDQEIDLEACVQSCRDLIPGCTHFAWGNSFCLTGSGKITTKDANWTPSGYCGILI